MTRAADIMAAATPGPWTDTDLAAGEVTGDAVTHIIASTYGSVPDARAIVTAVNLFPLYEAVREAATAFLFDDDISVEADALRAALDALQAAEDAL